VRQKGSKYRQSSLVSILLPQTVDIVMDRRRLSIAVTRYLRRLVECRYPASVFVFAISATVPRASNVKRAVKTAVRFQMRHSYDALINVCANANQWKHTRICIRTSKIFRQTKCLKRRLSVMLT